MTGKDRLAWVRAGRGMTGGAKLDWICLGMGMTGEVALGFHARIGISIGIGRGK